MKTDPEAVRRQRITLLTNALTATAITAPPMWLPVPVKELLSRFLSASSRLSSAAHPAKRTLLLHELLEQGFNSKAVVRRNRRLPRAVGFRQRRTGVTRHAILRTYLALKARVMEQQGL
ncbi:hypothetical protein DMI69_11625 [Escherichia coli]|nr:hypothetical protein [Escherichia coli]